MKKACLCEILGCSLISQRTIIERSLRDLGNRWVIAGRSLKDCWEIWPVFHRSTISQRSPPLCKGDGYLRYHSIQLPLSSCCRYRSRNDISPRLSGVNLDLPISHIILPGSTHFNSAEACYVQHILIFSPKITYLQHKTSSDCIEWLLFSSVPLHVKWTMLQMANSSMMRLKVA